MRPVRRGCRPRPPHRGWSWHARLRLWPLRSPSRPATALSACHRAVPRFSHPAGRSVRPPAAPAPRLRQLPVQLPGSNRAMVCSNVFLPSAILEAEGLERFAHFVDVEAELAGGEALALLFLICHALRCSLRDRTGLRTRHDHDTVIIRDDGIARLHARAGTDN